MVLKTILILSIIMGTNTNGFLCLGRSIYDRNRIVFFCFIEGSLWIVCPFPRWCQMEDHISVMDPLVEMAKRYKDFIVSIQTVCQLTLSHLFRSHDYSCMIVMSYFAFAICSLSKFCSCSSSSFTGESR